MAKRIERLEEEVRELKEALARNEARIVPPHKRLRKLPRGAIDYASKWHTEAEHVSHGQGSYRKRLSK